MSVAVFALLAAFEFFSFYSVPEKEDQNFQKQYSDEYQIYALDIPDQLTFLGEKVPLEQYDVREKLDRELLVNTYWQSQTLLFFKRSKKIFPAIEPILKKNGVPDDFKYLALIESGLMNVVSPSGAEGIWQIMKGTAREYALEITSDVDERYHLELATQAACEYLNFSNEKFNSWVLSAAAYNMGMNGMEEVLAKQGVSSYYDLHLNDETARYVFRMIAVKMILENPDKYGFNFREKDLYKPIPYYIDSVDYSIPDLAGFAREKGFNLKLLKTLNPWLRKNRLIVNPDDKIYGVKFPTEEYLNSINTGESK